MTRNEIITSGIYNLYKGRKNYLYKEFGEIDEYESYEDILTEEQFKECVKINKSDRQRKARTRERIIKWLFYKNNKKEYKLIFGTLTFSDETLNNTSKQTRRRYVQNFLRKNTSNYIANIDYGEINGREHYHFIALVKGKIDNKEWKDIINFQEIKSNDIERVKNYILKINNHTYKESTKRESLIVDKNREIEKIINLMWKEEYRKFRLNYV